MSVRQECLDHLLILHEKQLQRVLNEYVAYSWPDRIKGFGSNFLNRTDHLFPLIKQGAR